MDKRTAVLKHLKAGKSLTKLQAIKLFGMLNLGDCIHVLRRNHKIATHMIEREKGSAYACYKLVKE